MPEVSRIRLTISPFSRTNSGESFMSWLRCSGSGTS